VVTAVLKMFEYIEFEGKIPWDGMVMNTYVSRGEKSSGTLGAVTHCGDRSGAKC
jgi:hypothetical protein